MTKEIETARQARRSLAMVCERLQHPAGQYDASVQDLDAAVRGLQELEHRLKSAGPAATYSPMLAAEMSAIRREIAKAQALLVAAGKFYQGLARLMAVGDQEPANYTPRGTPAPVLCMNGGKMVVHG